MFRWAYNLKADTTNFLRTLRRPDGEVVDLATIDILRDRERGVPRYNAFREQLHRAALNDELECARVQSHVLGVKHGHEQRERAATITSGAAHYESVLSAVPRAASRRQQ